MKKRKYSTTKRLAACFCAVLMLLSASWFIAGADGEEYKENGWVYTVTDGKATILWLSAHEASIERTVPATLGGYPVVALGENALAGIAAERVIISEGIEVLGPYLFEQCAMVKEVILPSSVRVMESNVFSNCSALERVEFAEGLETVNGGIFYNCPKITHVKFPRSLRTVTGALFSYCDGVTEIELPEGVETVGMVARECSALERISLPASLQEMKNGFVVECGALREVHIEQNNKHFFVKNHCLLSSGGDLLYATEGAVIPTDGSVVRIADGAFQGADWLTELVVPAGVKEIGTQAFEGCKSLTKAVLSDGVESIGFNCFARCVSLTELSLPDTLVSIDTQAFLNCDSLQRVVLPDSVETMGYGVFMDCAKLETLVLSKSLESLPSRMVESCDSLRELTVPEGVKKLEVGALFVTGLERLSLPSTLTELDSNVFSTCESMTELTVAEGNPVFYADGYCLMNRDGTLVKMFRGNTFPEGVIAIGDHAFRSNRALREIVIPDGVKSIGRDAFNNCQNLEEVYIPDSVTEIGAGAFCHTALKEVYLSASVAKVGESMFEGCDELACIYLEASETPAGWHEFIYEHRGGKYYFNATRGGELNLVEKDGVEYEIKDGIAIVRGLAATDMTDIVIHDEVDGCPVRVIGERAFATSQIKSILLPDTVLTIGEGAFEDCNQLQTVRFPLSLVTLGEDAFHGCHRLEYAYLAKTVESVGWNAFWSCWYSNFVIECGAKAQPEHWPQVWHDPSVEIRWGVEPPAQGGETSDESSEGIAEESTEESSEEPSETPTVSVSEESSAAETPSESVSSQSPVASDVSEMQGDDGKSSVVWIVIGILVIAAGAVGVCLYLRKKK